MSGYASVDADIDAWIGKHQLVLFSSSADVESRATYLSSKSGDTFQIWIGLPQDGRVAVHLVWVDGPDARLPAPELEWIVPEAEISSALSSAIDEALALMAPFERHYPQKPLPQ